MDCYDDDGDDEMAEETDNQGTPGPAPEQQPSPPAPAERTDEGGKFVPLRWFFYVIGGLVAIFSYVAVDLNQEIVRLEARVDDMMRHERELATKKDIDDLKGTVFQRFDDLKELMRELAKPRPAGGGSP